MYTYTRAYKMHVNIHLCRQTMHASRKMHVQELGLKVHICTYGSQSPHMYIRIFMHTYVHFLYRQTDADSTQTHTHNDTHRDSESASSLTVRKASSWRVSAFSCSWNASVQVFVAQKLWVVICCWVMCACKHARVLDMSSSMQRRIFSSDKRHRHLAHEQIHSSSKWQVAHHACSCTVSNTVN